MTDYAEQERLDNSISHANHLENRIEELEVRIDEIASDLIDLREHLDYVISRVEERVSMIEFYRRQER